MINFFSFVVGKKYSEEKHVKKSEKSSVHDEEKARKGVSFKDLRKIDDEEGGGKKTVHHSKGSHKSYKKSGGASAHGAKFQEGSKRKKNNYKKGFREKYHKDEEKNHDSFYSNSQKSGEYKVFGKKHAKHSAQSTAKKSWR
ncbi:hypothetical protein NQ314_004035 [Rhamnusium bicolor]|uniref:Uncharacterized protein n=1 Tax=Rhamnusium bicolor TaxID=1586634 RepID=A0AAV8ZNB0_9CUCU|nr:hypothetical protein NQ314_004035 [Rhamnusium bicolor]